MASVLRHRLKSYPVAFLTGPRQSGKTTLARSTFPDFEYVSLENLQTREEAVGDPRGFLMRFEKTGGVIFDEAQRAPDLFSYLQQIVDEGRSGPYVLTGSQNFLLASQISQSLAGRTTILELMPFSLAEIVQRKAKTVDDLFHDETREDGEIRFSLDEILARGFFPRIHDRGLEPYVWLDDYVRTYVERDVRMLAGIGDLDSFTRFVSLCAGRTGQLLNRTSLGADAGVDQTTVKRWLSLLQASYIVTLLKPHHENFRKRLVKAPKIYFVDPGLLCDLLGIRDTAHLPSHPLRGQIVENLVINEIQKIFLNSGQRPQMFFWRDQSGHEIDLLLDVGGRRIPVEIKSGKTVAADFFKGLNYYKKLSGAERGILVYGGTESYMRQGHRVLSWAQLS